MTGCRIGRVKMKNGGADVHIFPCQKRSEVADSLVRNAREMSEDDQIEGYFVITLLEHGQYNLAFRLSRDGYLTPTMAPAYIAEVVRRATATRQEIQDIIDELF